MTTLLPSIGARVFHDELGPGVVSALVKPAHRPAQVYVRWANTGTECLTPAASVRVGAVPRGEMRQFLTIIGGCDATV